jgi:proteasome lid subunit RPN8/RPN11
MADDIQFGDVEETAPKRALRPDENRHFAVAKYGEVNDGELAIFVDLDVLAEMEAHALADTTVELGGVLLGGTYEDGQGRPFVVITDSLRAAHYESTKGSFKFTHDTWSAITRERQSFPAELAMVGWYHTHPDWGVFLSGLDLFICDNFFNKKLDVAYVIDPCRGDRGMFQWSGGEGQRVRRTGGFFVTASRFRAAELEYYVAELHSAMPAPSTTRLAAGSYPAPVVHLHQPPGQTSQWQTLAIAGGLALQFLLVALIAWRTLTPQADAALASDEKVALALEKLNASLETLDARRRAELLEGRARARSEFLDEAFRELKGTEDGAIGRLQARFDQTARLSEDVAARDAAIREMRGFLEDSRSKLQTLEATAGREDKRLRTKIEELSTQNDRLQADVQKWKAELASLNARLNPAAAGSAAEINGQGATVWWWLVGGVLGAIALVAGVWWIGGQHHGESLPGERATANQELTAVGKATHS